MPEPAPAAVGVVFLDVDGVLNTTRPDSPSLGLDPKLLPNFVQLARQLRGACGAARIVVSSDWRRRPELLRELDVQLHSALAAAGLPLDVLDGELFGGPAAAECRLCSIAPGAPSKPQGISEWLRAWGPRVANWAAVDDTDLLGLARLLAEADALPAELLEGHFVQTDETAGLTEQKVQEVVALLSAPWARRGEQLQRLAAMPEPPPSGAAGVAPPRSRGASLRCDHCGETFGAGGARAHMEGRGAEHCMFSEV